MKLLVYAALSLVGGAIPVAVGWLTKLTLDRLGTETPVSVLAALAGGLAAAGVVQSTLPHAVNYLRAEVGRAASLVAQDRLFASLGRFVGLGPFETPSFLDKVRLAREAGRTAPLMVLNGALGSLQACVTIGGFLASLVALAPMMAVFVLIFAIPVLVAEIRLSRRRAAMLWQVSPRERRELFFDQLLTDVDAAKEVRLFGIGDYLRGRMRSEREAVNAAAHRLDRRLLSVQTSLGLVAAAVSGIGLLWAVHRAAAGYLTAGDIAIFLTAVAGVQSSVTQLASETAQAHQAMTLLKHYAEIAVMAPDLPRPDQPRALPPLRGHIELRDVWFRYGEDRPWVLKGVNLTIPAGQSLGLVGLNGAGKSTLVKLICRFYDPTRGSILWDGTDIRDVEPEELRARLSAVFQDFMHYDLTARENIALGDLRALQDDERVIEAARKAGVHGVIDRLPLGYETLVSRSFFADSSDDKEGLPVSLSGGQMQRLALARMLLRDRGELLILDEPTSGLDAEAEYKLHHGLRDFRRGRTTLLISHRLGSVREADRIVVLSEGRIVESGGHVELMASNGPYARLFTLQASGYTEQDQTPLEGAVQ
ncbi:ABC transporter ATP-binding protein [Streptomyces sp. CC219B]|uniref:ABC transporter ATP-binding protein n=1 Tax=Streptomyces sp. CC219B TaxID=3044574 RepID=UPI0024A806E6|nr:ABC transporter ATP-binding protein [Streptomyces sp. CC219B]